MLKSSKPPRRNGREPPGTAKSRHEHHQQDYVKNYETSIQEYIEKPKENEDFFPEMLVLRREFEGRMRKV